jgi:glyoxylase-like metal-dependent hydrolase (beta-lactamase superfamily II)
MSPSFWSPLVVFAALGATQPALEVREVAPGVYAVLQPKPGRFDDSNSAVIVTDEGVVVVDTQAAPAGARAVLARLRTLTPLPVETVINTHWHSDHVGGNSVYREAYPAVRLLAHRHTREDVLSRAIPDHREELETLPARLEAAEQQLVTGLRRDGGELTDADRLELREAIDGRRAYLEQARELEFVLPDAVFDERVTLHRGETEIRLLHFPGHTRGDVVVFLPLERVLIPGDLLDDLPFTGLGSPAALVRTLRALEELDFDRVIPGHGRVREGKAHLRRVAGLFESIVEQASMAREEGLGWRRHRSGSTSPLSGTTSSTTAPRSATGASSSPRPFGAPGKKRPSEPPARVSGSGRSVPRVDVGVSETLG